MKQTVFLLGYTDAAKRDWIRSQEGDSGEEKPPIESSNTLGEHLCLPLLIKDDAKLRENSKYVLVSALEKMNLPKGAEKKMNFFNLICDADTSMDSLRIVQAIERNMQPSRFFNRSSCVMNTSRGRLPTVLANIPGCRVPRVKGLTPRSFSELEAACEKFGAWPVIIRARGYQAGKYMRLLEEKSQLHTLENEPWLYGDLWLIEFVDYMNEEKLYQKTRVVFIDGTPYPRHSISSDKWNVHSASRADLMRHDINLCRREEHLLKYLKEEGLDKYADVFSAINENIGLDVFGIDFALVGNEVVVFEANACMQFLAHKNIDSDDERYQHLYAGTREMKRALKKMLVNA